MPNIASHFVCAKLVSNILNIRSDAFFKGNILPDVIDLDNSHHKIHGSYCLIPDTEYYKKIMDSDSDLEKGYLCHLLLDKYFLEEFIPDNVDNASIDLFQPNLIYKDYTNLNILFVDKYGLDVEYITRIMYEFGDVKLDLEKFRINIESINTKTTNELVCLNFEKMCIFLENVSIRIAEELKN